MTNSKTFISASPIHKTKWSGHAVIGFGIGAFIGQAGNNYAHHHCAHQFTLAIEAGNLVTVISKCIQYQAHALFIPANTPHQLLSGVYFSLYIDPSHHLAHKLYKLMSNPAHVCEVPYHLQQQLNLCLQQDKTLTQGLTQFLDLFETSITVKTSNKFQQILEHLYQGIVQSDIPDRQNLAKIAAMSESRFSHWFKEETGLPLRSYRKWLRLLSGLTHMRQGQALTEIAHQAKFADQAHFTRTCVELFGVRPSELTKLDGQIDFIY